MLRYTAYLPLCCLPLCASIAWGQSFAGPVTAWYFQPAERSVLIVNGHPGSASRGPVLHKDVDAAAAAPGCRQVLIRRGGEWSLSPHAASAPLISAEQVAWSADGETALLAGNGQFQMLRSGTVSPAQPLPQGAIAALAVSAKGNSAALIVDGVLYRVSEQNELQTRQPFDAQALAFAGDALYAVQAGQVMRLTENGAAETVAEVPGALGLAADQAGRLIVIAGGEVALLERDGSIQRNATDTPVAAWQPGCHADHILLESRGGELAVFRSGGNAGIFFIPAARKEEN